MLRPVFKVSDQHIIHSQLEQSCRLIEYQSGKAGGKNRARMNNVNVVSTCSAQKHQVDQDSKVSLVQANFTVLVSCSGRVPPYVFCLLDSCFLNKHRVFIPAEAAGGRSRVTFGRF